MLCTKRESIKVCVALRSDIENDVVFLVTKHGSTICHFVTRKQLFLVLIRKQLFTALIR